jgi:hypothetical protein
MDQDRLHPTPAVRASISSDGLVLLDLRGGAVLAANTIGARIWQLIEHGHGRREIAQQLADAYDIPLPRARHDVDAFVSSLVARGLLAGDSQ